LAWVGQGCWQELLGVAKMAAMGCRFNRLNQWAESFRELLGHSDERITMIDTNVLNRGLLSFGSPADLL
jgi:hypothetical protein